MTRVAFADPTCNTIEESLEEIKKGNEFLKRFQNDRY